MGTYQGRQRAPEDSSHVIVTTPSDPKGTQQEPPIFGSPIDTDSYLVSIANNIGLHTHSASPQSDSTSPSTSKPTSREELLQDGHHSEFKEKDKSPELLESTIPIVFHWDHGGKEVYVCGSFNEWERIPMTKSRENFTTIIELPEGRHEYKFYVDGQWVHDPGEEVQDNGLGTLNNVVSVLEKDFDAFNEQIDATSLQKHGVSVSPEGSYGQLIPSRSATTGLPPYLPPLLQQTILNDPPVSDEHPTLMPTPNHVILNHLYALSIKDGVLVMAMTSRYKAKYITTLMYKPVL